MILIPEELIGIILRFAIIEPHGRDLTAILPCARVSREFRSEVERILYSSIRLSSARQIVQCFTTIVKRKEHAARFVRSLEIELKDYHTAFPPFPRTRSLLTRPIPGVGDDGRLLSGFYSLVMAALRSMKQLQHYNLRIGPSSPAENGYVVPFLPVDAPFALKSFGCISMDISPPIVNFLVSQPAISEFIAPEMFPPYRLGHAILPAVTTVRGPPELLKRLVPHRPVTVVQSTSLLDPDSMMFILPKLSASTATIHTLTIPVANARTACNLLPFIARSLPSVESLSLPHRSSFRGRSDPYDIYKEDAFALALGTFQGLKHLEVPTMDSFVLAPPNPFATLGANLLGAHPFPPFPPFPPVPGGDGGHGDGNGNDLPEVGNQGDAPGDLHLDDDDNDDGLFGDPGDMGAALDDFFGFFPAEANPNQVGPPPPAHAAQDMDPFAALLPQGFGNGAGAAHANAAADPHVVPVPLDAAAFGNMVQQVMGMNFPGAPVAGNNHPPPPPPPPPPPSLSGPNAELHTGHGAPAPPQQPPVPGVGNAATGLPALLGNMMNNVMALLHPLGPNAAPPPATLLGPPPPPAAGTPLQQGAIPHPPNIGGIQPGPFPPDLLNQVINQIMGIFEPHAPPQPGPAPGAQFQAAHAHAAHPQPPAGGLPQNNQLPPGPSNASTNTNALHPAHPQLNNVGVPPHGGPQPMLPQLPPFPAFAPGGVPHAFTFNGPMFDGMLQFEHLPAANISAPPGPGNPTAAATGNAGGGVPPWGGAPGGAGHWIPVPALPPFATLGQGGAGQPAAAGPANVGATAGVGAAGPGGGGNIAHLVLTFPPIHIEPVDPNDPHVIEERRARQRALVQAQRVRAPVELQILNLWQARCPSLHSVTFQMERDRYVVWTKDAAGQWTSEYTPPHPEQEGKTGSQ